MVRTCLRSSGEFINVADLQAILIKDALTLTLTQDGLTEVAQYAEGLANALGDMR